MLLAYSRPGNVRELDHTVEQLKFQLGQRTSVEVLDAASNLADAQLRKISAFASYEIAQVYLARATGTLLGYGRIQLHAPDAAKR